MATNNSQTFGDWWRNHWFKITPLTLILLGFGGFWGIYEVFLKPSADDSYNKSYNLLKATYSEMLDTKNSSVDSLGNHILKLSQQMIEKDNQIISLKNSIDDIKSIGKFLTTFELKVDEETHVMGGHLSIQYNNDKYFTTITLKLDTCYYWMNEDCIITKGQMEINDGSLVPFKLFDDAYYLHFIHVQPNKPAEVVLYLKTEK